MHKIITMSDSAYFGAGKLFLKTRDKLSADVTLYSPDLTKKQIKILNKNNISYIKIDPELFKNKMQFLKFDFIIEQIKLDINHKYNGFTFIDWDTFFINDWEQIFEKYNFDFGITVRNDLVKKRVLRAYTNGGVMFAKRASYEFLQFIRKVILNGNSKMLPEYDEIWKTLEEGRPIHKTHTRNVLRWWVDQVIISSLALRYFRKNEYKKIGLKPEIFSFENTKIGLFSCNNYNVVESSPIITDEKNIYIRHLKNTGRSVLHLEKIKEKL